MQKKLLTGMVLGAAAAMLIAPEMDRTTKRRIKKAKNNMKDMAEDAYDGMIRIMK